MQGCELNAPVDLPMISAAELEMVDAMIYSGTGSRAESHKACVATLLATDSKLKALLGARILQHEVAARAGSSTPVLLRVGNHHTMLDASGASATRYRISLAPQ